SQIVHEIYVDEQLPQAVEWGSLPRQEARQFEEQVLILHYTDEEELFVEWPYEMMQETILEGMQELFAQENRLLTVQDWRTLLRHREAEMTRAQRFAALCVLSRVDVSDIADRLLRGLESPDMQESWVSARLLGGAHDERALPVLISMLTENWEVHRHTD